MNRTNGMGMGQQGRPWGYVAGPTGMRLAGLGGLGSEVTDLQRALTAVRLEIKNFGRTPFRTSQERSLEAQLAAARARAAQEPTAPGVTVGEAIAKPFGVLGDILGGITGGVSQVVTPTVSAAGEVAGALPPVVQVGLMERLLGGGDRPPVRLGAPPVIIRPAPSPMAGLMPVLLLGGLGLLAFMLMGGGGRRNPRRRRKNARKNPNGRMLLPVLALGGGAAYFLMMQQKRKAREEKIVARVRAAGVPEAALAATKAMGPLSVANANLRLQALQMEMAAPGLPPVERTRLQGQIAAQAALVKKLAEAEAAEEAAQAAAALAAAAPAGAVTMTP